ncbi:MAG: hypothetical protein GWP38_05400 [Planctomycetia bacterium]|nr:hypothetical protein [Planctomycetia bacterium]
MTPCSSVISTSKVYPIDRGGVLFFAIALFIAGWVTPFANAQTGSGPVKVFILAGQSNMEGHGEISPIGTPGTLEYSLNNNPTMYGHLTDGTNWVERDDVWIWYNRGGTTVVSGHLTAGYGASNTTMGPELQWGHALGDLYDEPVLLIKTAWGGKSLAVDFRPPSSGWSVNPPVAPGDQGYYYQEVLDTVSDVLTNLQSYFPDYNGQGYELVGLGWHQGWNDRVNQSYNDEYEQNLENFIQDIRVDLATPNLPFVIATTGMSGWSETHPRALSLMAAQLAMENSTIYPQFEGNVAVVDTRDFWRDLTVSPADQSYHWNRNAETYFLIGAAMAQEMNLLLNPPSGSESIDAVYLAQSHVQKPSDPYFGLVSQRDALLKVHVVDPNTPAAPPVTAVLNLNGQVLNLNLTGPTTLPASIPDGPGIVQHSFDDSFTATIPAGWVQPGLQITVNAGVASTTLLNLEIGAPTKVIMTMFDVQYFSDTSGDYPAGTFAELESKWPVSELEVRRLEHVVFPELVIPPRSNLPAARVRSQAEYLEQTGQPFDGEQAAALAWNRALKRAGGLSGRYTLSYINIYGVNAGGQAGGFAGVGNGTSQGVLIHELGHALSLPHWANDPSYPYVGSMFGIDPPGSNNTHVGPTWAFDAPTQTFLPPIVQTNNPGNHPSGTYKVDPMQGGGNGYQEPVFLMNHFSDYSMNQMRNYLEGHVVIWNDNLGQYASWNQAAADYTSTVSNNGVQFPIERDVPVISVMASVSGANPKVSMAYPPIGPYTGSLIQLFDPTSATDRATAQSIFAPAEGCDVCVRVIQGGIEKTYMLAASWEPGIDPLQGNSLRTEAINLPAADGEVTRIQLLLTPDAEINGLPANPEVLHTWAKIVPNPAAFDLAPIAGSSSAITMRAVPGTTSTGDPIEYFFAEVSGNPGGTTSGWQSSASYTDIGLQPSTEYSYFVTMRSGLEETDPSDVLSSSTHPSGVSGMITVDETAQFSLQSGIGLNAVTGLAGFDAAGADKLVVTVGTEHGFNNGEGYVFEVRYSGVILTEVVQEDAGVNNGTAAIFYLDNPGPIGSGTIEVSASSPNGGIGAAYALSGTTAGYGASNTSTGNTVTSVTLTTSGENSLLIAALENSGNPNGSGTAVANVPMTSVASGFWGSQWGSHASGYLQVATPDMVTPTFSTNIGANFSINVVAAEFLAQVDVTLENFKRGDCNADGEFNIADAVCGLEYLFGGGVSTCLDAIDANDDGAVDISDPVYVLSALFSGGPEPIDPFGNCGIDPTGDALDCDAYLCP